MGGRGAPALGYGHSSNKAMRQTTGLVVKVTNRANGARTVKGGEVGRLIHLMPKECLSSIIGNWSCKLQLVGRRGQVTCHIVVGCVWRLLSFFDKRNLTNNQCDSLRLLSPSYKGAMRLDRRSFSSLSSPEPHKTPPFL